MNVEVFVEIPKGSRNKYEFDKRRGVIRFDRLLFSSVHYPSDYGFIPETLADDGDPLDALVLVWEATFPGCVIDARPVGVLRMEDGDALDEKVLCVPLHDPLWSPLESLGDVPAHLLREIEHFFSIYKQLEDKPTRSLGWNDRPVAEEVVTRCRRLFQEGAGS